MQIDITLDVTQDNKLEVIRLLELLTGSNAISEYELKDCKELINDYDFE